MARHSGLPAGESVATQRRAIFLDRDGTLNVEKNFVRHPDEIEILPGVVPALRDLKRRGFELVVVTNQSGIARGYFDPRTLSRIHDRTHELLEGLPSAYLHCPHHPDLDGPYGGACRCRKPGTGLIERAAAVLDLSIAGSWIVGDSARDLVAPKSLPQLAGTILVRSGKPWQEQLRVLQDTHGIEPSAVCDDLSAAASTILA